MLNEILFYGGAGITVCSLLTAAVYIIISKVHRRRLNAQLDLEYGEIEEKQR